MLSAVVTNPATESRLGPAQTIVFTFDKTIADALAIIAEGVATTEIALIGGHRLRRSRVHHREVR